VSKITRRCIDCNIYMPLDWNKQYCKFCGGRVQVDVSEGKSAQTDVPAWTGVPAWNDQTDMDNWRKKRFKPVKKITGRENDGVKYVTGAETPRTSLSSLSPFVLFCCAFLTLGVSSLVWILRRLILINHIVHEDERVRVAGFYIWIFSYAAALGIFGWAVWNYVMSFDGGVLAYMRESWLVPLALLYFVIAFFMSRHYLFWVRGAIAEAAAAQKSGEPPDNDSYRFAFKPLAIWYFGVAYIQMHVNRALNRGLLTKSSFMDARDEQEDELTETEMTVYW
jgi:hypothetical protein